MRAAFASWWQAEAKRVAELPAALLRGKDAGRGGLMRLRAELLESFVAELGRVGLLDRYALAGAVAGWWQDVQYDLRAIVASGFDGVVDGWLDTVDTTISPEDDPRTGKPRNKSAAERRRAYGHRLVSALIPDFLDELTDADARKAELDAQWKAATGVAETDGDADDGAYEPDTEVEPLERLSDEELAQLKKDRTKAAKVVKQLEADFWPRLTLARATLDPDRERDLVLGILRDNLSGTLDSHLTRHHRRLLETYQTWESKYSDSLRKIESRAYAAVARLDSVLTEIGYV